MTYHARRLHGYPLKGETFGVFDSHHRQVQGVITNSAKAAVGVAEAMNTSHREILRDVETCLSEMLESPSDPKERIRSLVSRCRELLSE